MVINLHGTMSVFREKVRSFFHDKHKNKEAGCRTSDHGCGQVSPAPAASYIACASAVSDVGKRRQNNEDNFLLGQAINEASEDHAEAHTLFFVRESAWFAAGVFDGMGGGEAGEIAAKIAASCFAQACSRFTSATEKAEADALVREAFRKSNSQIISLQEKYQIYGTTGSVVCFHGSEFKVFHLGDSRVYLHRNGALTQLTKDQTLAQMKKEMGMYSDNDPQIEADNHKLTEYIGCDWTGENLKPVESAWMEIHPNDQIVLCSDGLYDMCSDADILQMLHTGKSVMDMARDLVSLSLSCGGLDNSTCIVVTFAEKEEVHSALAE